MFDDVDEMADITPQRPHSLTEIVHALTACRVPRRAARRTARAVVRRAYQRQAARPFLDIQPPARTT